MDLSPDPSMPMSAQIIFLICLILIGAVFKTSETAILSLNKNKVKNAASDGNKKAERLLKLLENQDKHLSAIQIVITFVTILATAILTIGLSVRLTHNLAIAGVAYPLQISILIITLVFAFIVLILGKFYPIKVANRHPEKIAIFFVSFIAFFSLILTPVIFILTKLTNLFLLITKQNSTTDADEFFEDEVMSMLEVGKETGVLKEEGQKMITSIFAFDDKLAEEIMTPRTDVFTIDIDDEADEYMDELMTLRYSRIPVYENDSDNIIGILNIKDFFINAKEVGFNNVDIKSILREPYFVPATKKIDDLFFDLQKTKKHMAILIDEYGGFSGIVTMEDIIEEVMGDITDEYDEDELEIEQIDESTYMINGLVSLDDLNEQLGINLESDNIDTIGGFIIDILGEIPADDGEEANLQPDADIGIAIETAADEQVNINPRVVEYHNLVFTIESVKERRIEKVKLHIMPEEELTENEDTTQKSN